METPIVPSVLVIILQGETSGGDKHIQQLQALFSEPYFHVEVVNVQVHKANTSQLTTADFLEQQKFRRCLSYAAEGPWNKLPCIIVKDSSICYLTPSTMTRRIKAALDTAVEADLFYLCKWQDNCHTYMEVPGNGSLKWTSNPNATQAIMFTPRARDFILAKKELFAGPTSFAHALNAAICTEELSATAFVPNIIDFDIDLATSPHDYQKLNECATVQVQAYKSTSGYTYLWLLLVVILLLVIILLVCWLIYRRSAGT